MIIFGFDERKYYPRKNELEKIDLSLITSNQEKIKNIVRYYGFTHNGVEKVLSDKKSGLIKIKNLFSNDEYMLRKIERDIEFIKAIEKIIKDNSYKEDIQNMRPNEKNLLILLACYFFRLNELDDFYDELCKRISENEDYQNYLAKFNNCITPDYEEEFLKAANKYFDTSLSLNCMSLKEYDFIKSMIENYGSNRFWLTDVQNLDLTIKERIYRHFIYRKMYRCKYVDGNAYYHRSYKDLLEKNIIKRNRLMLESEINDARIGLKQNINKLMGKSIDE